MTKQQATLPETGLLRQSHLTGNKKMLGICPFSASTLLRMVNDGTFPAPFRLGDNKIKVWRAEDVRAWFNAQGKAE